MALSESVTQIHNLIHELVSQNQNLNAMYEGLVRKFVEDRDYENLIVTLVSYNKKGKYIIHNIEDVQKRSNLVFTNILPKGFETRAKDDYKLLGFLSMVHLLHSNLAHAAKMAKRAKKMTKLAGDAGFDRSIDLSSFDHKKILALKKQALDILIEYGVYYSAKKSLNANLILMECSFDYKEALSDAEKDEIKAAIFQQVRSSELDIDKFMKGMPRSEILFEFCTRHFKSWRELYSKIQQDKELMTSMIASSKKKLAITSNLTKRLRKTELSWTKLESLLPYDDTGKVKRMLTLLNDPRIYLTEDFPGILDDTSELIVELEDKRCKAEAARAKADFSREIKGLAALVSSTKNPVLKKKYLELKTSFGEGTAVDKLQREFVLLKKESEAELELLTKLKGTLTPLKISAASLPENLKKQYSIEALVSELESAFKDGTAEDISNKFNELSYLVSNLSGVVKHIQQVNSLIQTKDASYLQQVKKSKIFELVERLGRKRDFAKVQYLLYSLEVLTRTLNGLSAQHVSKCLKCIREGKCESMLSFLQSRHQDKEVDAVQELYDALEFKISKFEFIKRVKRLEHSIGVSGIKHLAAGNSLFIGITHYTKDVFPALRGLGISAHSTKTTSVQHMQLSSEDSKRLRDIQALISKITASSD